MKRMFDLIISFVGLCLLSPILLFLAVIVRIKLGTPLKFRTMRDVFDSHGKPLKDELRMTKFGSFLRSTSLDELPSLWNVLKGDMSLVGPRPLLVDYLPLYNEEQNRRHEVRPGVTGWAQVNGRNAISWEDKFKLDIWYVDNASILLDLKIILLTLKKVLFREGISASGEVTASRFQGSPRDKV